MKRSLTLVITAALLAGYAPASVAVEKQTFAKTSVSDARKAKIQQAREQRNIALAAAKAQLGSSRANIAQLAAIKITELESKLEADVARTGELLPAKEKATLIKKINKDHAKAVKAIENKSIIDRRAVMKKYASDVKAINAAYKNAIKTA